MERISTGIDDLDVKLKGGYPKNREILITGDSGTGKTIFGIHFIHRSCTEGKKCILIATEEKPDDILQQAKILELDLSGYLNSNQLLIERVFESRAQKSEQVSKYGFAAEGLEIYLPTIANIIPKGTDIVVIDNIGVFTIYSTVQDFRAQFDSLIYFLSEKGCTTMFVMDDTAHNMTNQIADYSVYGIVRLMVKENPYTGNMERYISIPKMRSTDILPNLMRFEIKPNGITLQKPSQ
jgi:flagellar protein FlaH